MCRYNSTLSSLLKLTAFSCDSYNTSQIRLFSSNDNQRDGTGSGQDRGISTAAPRELAEPFVETRRSMARPIPVTDSALDIPKTGPGSATGPSSTFSHNYNARSVSPTVGNYFGLSRRRGSIWTTISHPEAVHSEGEPEDQEHSTSWAVSALRRATLGFLGNRESCEEGSGEDDKNSNNEEEEFEDIAEEVEEYEEVDDLMDIFGHR